MAAGAKHLFLCGCARSGTTALWRLMVSHPAIVLGLERYLLKTVRGEPMTPDLFGRERFFNPLANESTIGELSRLNYYKRARRRFDAATYVGDKQPGLYRMLDAVDENFTDATVLCILRNIIDVAGSFQRRALNTDGNPWNPKRDYTRALEDWGTCLARVQAFVERPGRRTRLLLVSYEDLFAREADLARLFGALDLDVDAKVAEAYAVQRADAPALEERRADGLNSAQRNHVALQAPFDAYRALHALRLDLSLPAERA